MRRRSTSSSERAKGRRRKTKTQKAGRHSSSSVAGQETEVARFHRERDEALERETATSEVLRIISNSPNDLQSALGAIAESAARLLDVAGAEISRVEGDGLRLMAKHGSFPQRPVGSIRPINRSWVTGRAVTDRTTVQVVDLQAAESEFPEGAASARQFGHRTTLATPLLREGKPIGAILIRRMDVRPFTDKQIAVLQNFAAQAVIAIENARLFEAEQQRTRELSESLEQQTAISEVLKVISGSPTDIQPVLDIVGENAARLCEANNAVIFRLEGNLLRHVASYGHMPTTSHPLEGLPVSRDTVTGRAVFDRRTIHVHDLSAEDHEYPEGSRHAKVDGHRTTLATPLLREGVPVGAILIRRMEVRPFSPKQIELVTTFADQAAIAIENTRLLNELRQSLDQQTATSEVLRVISSSPGELEPVFNTMLANATRLCDATFGILYLSEADGYRAVAMHNVPLALVEARQNKLLQFPADAAVTRAATTKQPCHHLDARTQQSYVAGDPQFIASVNLGGMRTVVSVPILKDGQLIGVISIYRQEVRPFTDKQIALVENFAAQAVIAIENARLLNDLNKLNQQLEQRVADQVGEIERMSRLRRFLPPQVADLIVASGTEKQLESHRREITALFCDLRGFTGFSESSDPEDVMTLLSEYHAAIGEIIIKYSGTLERYAGDGVMVIFNDPVPVENPALQAVLMALDMRTAIGGLIEKWRDLGHDLGFGIGIAHGFATLGTIGFEGRRDYAAIGTVSNVASRLCDEAKPGQILISPRVRQAVEKAVMVEPVAEFTLKGIRRPMLAYNVLESPPSKPN